MFRHLRTWLNRPATETPPVPIDTQRVDDACAISEKFLRANWQDLTLYVETAFPPANHHAAWTAITKRWLENTATFLGKPYHVHESPRALLLTARDRGAARGLLQMADGVCKEWEQLLNGVAQPAWKGKVPILLLENRDHYYDCIAALYPDEGEFAVSTGMFTTHGIPHIIIHGDDGNSGPPTLVHELTHGTLARLHLPRWLDEGFAQIAERIAGIDFNPTLHDLERNRYFWRAHGLEEFWQGESFLNPTSSLFSYQLAQIITQNLLATQNKKIPALLKAIQREDGGAAGVQKVLGLNLDDLAKPFLGDYIGAHESEWTDDEEFESHTPELSPDDEEDLPDKH